MSLSIIRTYSLKPSLLAALLISPANVLLLILLKRENTLVNGIQFKDSMTVSGDKIQRSILSSFRLRVFSFSLMLSMCLRVKRSSVDKIQVFLSMGGLTYNTRCDFANSFAMLVEVDSRSVFIL